MPLIHQQRTRLSHDIMQPAERLLERGTHSTPEGVSGEGKPGCAFGPHRGGENQSVSVGPSPLHETRTKNRRSTTDWQTSIDLTRIGIEQHNVRPHRSYPFWCFALYWSWPIHCTESITRGVSQQKMLAFFTEHSRLSSLDGVEQGTQRGARPRETVETALDGGCRALGRRPLPRRLQRVERRRVTRRGELSRVFMVGVRAPAPASARDGGPARCPNARALSLRPGEKQARKRHGGTSSVAGPRRRAAGRQLACASPVPVAVLAVPSSPGPVGWRSASSLPAFLLGERTSSVSSWQRQTRSSPPTGRRRMNQQYQRIT